MFYDYAKIYVKGGDGGNGVVAFRREKYVPFGGPAGGDGGGGGSVVFVGDEGLRTLVDFKYKQHYKAERGMHGQGKNMHGKTANDMLVRVPVGTIVKDAESEELLGDITTHGQELVVAKGGKGGRGNTSFFSPNNKVPEVAENGEPGQEHWLTLELKLLADVALVGMPNAGKSTIISRISAAKPKIADYPFTTLVPNLGVVALDDGNSFVVADVPGLIKGAHEGAGLGHRFLRHVERCRVILHVLDMSGLEEQKPWEDFAAINEELKLYRSDLAKRPQIIVANKMDMPEAAGNLAILKEKLGDKYEIYLVIALKNEGLMPVIYKAWELIQNTPLPLGIEPTESMRHVIVKAEEPFVIETEEQGVWRVKGEKIERLVAMTDWDNSAAVTRMQRIFDKMGLDQALRLAGVAEGDLVCIGKEKFNFAE